MPKKHYKPISVGDFVGGAGALRGGFLHLGSVRLRAHAVSGNPGYGSPYPHYCCQGDGLTDESREAYRR